MVNIKKISVPWKMREIFTMRAVGMILFLKNIICITLLLFPDTTATKFFQSFLNLFIILYFTN